jgi:hypothetical protein
MDNPFLELDVDPVVGSEIMMIAGIHADDLMDINNVAKLRDIMSFFKNMPDRNYFISKLITGKPGINAIDHLWGYAQLRTQYEDLNKKASELKDQLTHYER